MYRCGGTYLAMNWFSSGESWMRIWAITLVLVLAWCVMTVLFWLDSVKNLNLLSLVALILSCAAGFQSTLGMRKADKKDDF